ncbi:MAG: cation-transporting P-type ATPase [Syntrophotaleaceae bacterium]
MKEENAEGHRRPKKGGDSREHWWALDAGDVMARLESSLGGLTPEEAVARLERFGPNRLPPPPRKGPIIRFLLHFHNLLIYVLLVSAVVTFLLGDWFDALVILGVTIINALIGFIQEGKAEKAVDAIRNILTQEATVLRGGKRQIVPAEDLVPGDVVLLISGDKVPADLRLLKTRDLRIEEAALTGESVTAEKRTDPVAPKAPLGDRYGMAYSGTLVVYGQATGIVTSTGETTELGKVNALLSGVQTLTTRLTEQINEFSQWLTVAILVLAVATLVFGLVVRDYSFGAIFLASVALAVAAIPEGLPAIITITLALGMQRMARRSAIIRRLPAVETLGSVTVICTDKTGTLTRNEMTVTTVITREGTYAVEGVGYEPRGDFNLDGRKIVPDEDPLLTDMARAALLCNEGVLRPAEEGGWETQGDPTDIALLTLAGKAGLDFNRTGREYPRLDVIPFESDHKFMATLNSVPKGAGVVYLKGAPERVLERCDRQAAAGSDLPLDIPFWREKIEEIARRGERTLALARLSFDERKELSFEDVQGGLTLLGFLGIIDPPREEASASVAQCRDAGIRVKMITGDHALTAAAIGERMGLGGPEPVTGEELSEAEEGDIRLLVQRSDIFARVSPEHKLRLVQALQSNGEVVAMTGDGVNDAPALKRADVGIAMGLKGTEAAKEAAEMVLADDNFATIAHAVEEGRAVYDNVKKALAFVLPTNGALAGIVITGVLAGEALPITALQILWINMVSAVTLGLALAFEPPESEVMRRPPRDPQEALLTPFMIWRIGFTSLIMVIGTFGLFLWDTIHGAPLEIARTTAVNTLIFFQIFYLLNARYMKASVLNLKGITGNRYVLGSIALILILQVLFTYVPIMQRLFGTAAIPAEEWLRLIAFTFSIFILVELEKLLFRIWERRRRMGEALRH